MQSRDGDDSGRMGPSLVFGRTRLVGRLHLLWSRVLLHRSRARCRDGPQFQKLVS